MKARQLLSHITNFQPDNSELINRYIEKLGIRNDLAARYVQNQVFNLDVEIENQTENKDSESNTIEVNGPIVTKFDSTLIQKLGGEAISAYEFTQAINRISKQTNDITININSPGGSIYDLIQILSVINQTKKDGKKINTVVTGLAASAAGILFLYGDKRGMNHFSQIMFHRAIITVLFRGNIIDLGKFYTSAQKQLTDFDNAVIDKIHDISGIDKETINQKITDDYYLSPKDALANDFATYEIKHDSKSKKITNETNDSFINSLQEIHSNIVHLSHLSIGS